MPTYYVSQGGGSIGSGSYRGIWVASQTYVAGDRVVPTRTYATAAAKFYIYECTTGGASGGSEPTWVYASPGTSTTTDNAATWTCRACTTWANANIYLSYMAANDAAGDTFYVKNDLNESYAGAITMDWAGSAASPTRVICVSDTGEPPTTVATGAVCGTSGANNFTIANSNNCIYYHGIRFIAGSSTNAADVNCYAALGIFSSCALELAGNNAASDFNLGTTTTVISLIGCSFKSLNAGSLILLGSSTYMSECSIEAGGTPGNPFMFVPSGSITRIVSFNFSNLGASSNLFSVSQSACLVDVINSQLPSSWSGSINSLTPDSGGVFILTNSDSADTNYRLEKKAQFGTVTQDTGIYVTAGASDGTTHISWKMVSNANAEWLHQTIDSPEIVRWNESTGSALTVTCEFLIDSATTLNNNDVWMEVQYLGTSGAPLGSIDIDSRCATYLTTAAECTTGAGTGAWTGEGGSAKSYKLVSTITPQEKGFIHAVVKLAKASTTIYVDPKITVS